MRRNKISIFLGLLMLVGLFGIAVQPAMAELNATAAFYVWDDGALQYKNSIADLWLDGTETHVIHELGFDNDFYDPNDGSVTQRICDNIAALGAANDPTWREDCPPDVAGAGNGAYAGVMELGIPYDDIDGARAFDHSLNWSLIDCDLNGDLSWNTSGGPSSDLKFNTIQDFNLNGDPLLSSWDVTGLTTPAPSFPIGDARDFFKILAIDKKTACGGGNCANELVTTIFIDLDINGDNALTEAGDGTPVDGSNQLEGGRVCFFARVFPVSWPTDPATPVWSGNPQARITAGGGAKTVNFNLYGPTAITLENLTARSDFSAFMVFGGVLIVLVASLIVVAAWRMRQQREAT